MEKNIRKIVKIGSSFFVNIPMGFVRYNKIQRGDVVEVVTSDVVTIKLTGSE